MSHLIAGHAHAVRSFCQILKANRKINICCIEDKISISTVLTGLTLSGQENRPFTEAEIKKVLKRYEHFEKWLRDQDLWLNNQEGE